MDPLTVDTSFFTALVEARLPELDRLLAEDFVLVDVMSGSEVNKPALLAVLASGQLKFANITLVESRVRQYGTSAVINGRTQMSGSFDGMPFAASSRYHTCLRPTG
jgi:Domain of unknown function (DUF4440)